jgi:hypothetical protein
MVHGFQPPDGRRGAAGDGGQRSADENAGLIAVGSRRNGLRHVGGHVIRGQLARGETSPGRAQRTLDPVDPERPPVAAIDVPGQEVPAARGVHQAMRLDVASADASSPGVGQVQPALVPARRRDRGQPLRVHLVRPGTRPGQRDRRGVEGGDPVPEPGRQRLLELGR